MTAGTPHQAYVRRCIAAARGRATRSGPAVVRTESNAEVVFESTAAAAVELPPDTAFIADSLGLAEANMRRDPAIADHDMAEALDVAREAYASMRDGAGLDLRGAVMMEAIQVFDGSRPAVLIRPDGSVSTEDPELGDWKGDVVTHYDAIQTLAQSVALIGLPAGAIGSGFRVGGSRLVTNRHVLELIGIETAQGWRILDGADARFSLVSVAITGVVFAGAQTIGGFTDLSRLDVAVLQLAGPDVAGLPVDGRLTDAGTGWPLQAERALHVIGYPLGYGDVLGLQGAEKLYLGKIGKLCWSPGRLTVLPGVGFGDAAREWAIGYDISTLPGNSGSVVADLQANPSVALGLHIGGATQMGNWAHWLAGASNLLRGSVAFAP